MIVDRYLLKEILYAFMAVLGVLLLIFSGNHFVRYLGEAAAGELPGELVFQLLLVLSLGSLDLLLPLSFFIAVLIGFGRLYKDSEMTALAACGVGPGRIFRAMRRPIAICVAVVALVAFWLKPWAVEQSYQLREQAAARSDITGVGAGKFRRIESAERVFYVEELSGDEGGMRNIFIQGSKGERQDVFTAPQGSFSRKQDHRGQFLILRDGHRYEGLPSSPDFRIYDYQEAGVRVETEEADPAVRKPTAYPTAQLWGTGQDRLTAELQWRASMPLSAALLAVLAMLLSYTTPREGRFAKLFGAILIYIAYSNLLGVAQAWLARGQISPWLGLWWVHGLLAGVILALLVKRLGPAWLRRLVMGRGMHEI